jgi:non-specific serine/threonine protein kinase/serine/threonine-protein kinase
VDENRWQRLDAILQEALDLAPEERDDLLHRRCPDPADRERLEQMIAAAEGEDATLATGGALRGALGEEVTALLDEGARPDNIPGYHLLRPLGSGGMGDVWEAEQREPVQRRVAVKIIRPGADTAQVVARFESERQTLALMNHPGIAQIYDAGVTDSGRPFFAMELVHGAPVTRFCDEARLTIPERLRLFGEICEAVQHAHRKGVIHRDLKPSNVLVTKIEGRPAPKVIDFGIARLVESSATEGTMLTEAGTVIGTPEYMSPEQAGAGPGDVDTRSDVYSLGVLLYELLTGSLPFERRDSTPAALADFFQDVRRTELAWPSKYVSRLGDAADAAASDRKIDRATLTKALRGDLDWITTRTLEKDRDRRYESAGELAADLQRHLRHEPVVASPPGAAYRFRKFVRRHRGLIATSAAVFIALLAGLAGTVTGLVRAREQAERAGTQAAIAEAVNAFLNEDLLAAVAPGSQGRDVGMREVLDTAADRLEGRFADQPEVEASLRRTMGRTYLALGALDEAASQLERAVTLGETSPGGLHPSTLEAVHVLGEVRFYQGRADEAEELLRRAFEGRTATLGPAHALTLSALSDLGAVSHHRGNLDEAERCYREAYERARTELGESDPHVLSMLHNLGALMRDLGRLEEAEAYLRSALEGSRREYGDDHPETLATQSQLGSVLREGGQVEEAEPIYVQVYEARRRVLGDDHPSTLLSANNLAMLHMDLGRLEEAEAIQRTTLATQRRTLGDDHDGTILSMANLSALLTDLGRTDESEALIEEAMERCNRTLGASHPLCAGALRKYGECLTAQGRYPEAEAAFFEVHEVLADAYENEGHPELVLLANAFVELYEAWGRAADAAEWRDRPE